MANSTTRKRIIKNLVQIGMLFPADITPTAHLRFWKAYSSEYLRYSPYRSHTNFMRMTYKKTPGRLVNAAYCNPREPDLPQQHFTDGLIVPSLKAK